MNYQLDISQVPSKSHSTIHKYVLDWFLYTKHFAWEKYWGCSVHTVLLMLTNCRCNCLIWGQFNIMSYCWIIFFHYWAHCWHWYRGECVFRVTKFKELVSNTKAMCWLVVCCDLWLSKGKWCNTLQHTTVSCVIFHTLLLYFYSTLELLLVLVYIYCPIPFIW